MNRKLPVWIRRIEAEEGMPMRDILTATADAARITGYTMADLAREWGVSYTTLQRYTNRWGVRFPRGASGVQRETVARPSLMKASHRNRTDLWQPADDSFLMEAYPDPAWSIRKIAEKLNRTPEATQRRARFCGVKRPKGGAV